MKRPEHGIFYDGRRFREIGELRSYRKEKLVRYVARLVGKKELQEIRGLMEEAYR